MTGARKPVPQLDALTGIRGIAAWFVVLFHVRFSLATLVPPGTVAMLGKGYLAVDLFFMLSGFVMWLNYGARLRQGGMGEVRAFWWRRFARIWPLHAAILTCLVPFALVLLATGRNGGNYPFPELPLHYLLVQNWGFTQHLSWNHPAWSISTEMAAYILFPVLALGLPWERLRPPLLIGGAAALCLALHLLFALNGETGLGVRVEIFGLPRCLIEFSLGMVLCRFWQQCEGRRVAAWLAGAMGAGAIALGLYAALPETAFLPAAFALLLLALALGQGPVSALLGSRPLRWLGDISYSTYLVHFPLFVLFKLLFVGPSLQLGWAGLAAFLALVLAASALLYRLLEKPAQRWLNRHPPRVARVHQQPAAPKRAMP